MIVHTNGSVRKQRNSLNTKRVIILGAILLLLVLLILFVMSRCSAQDEPVSPSPAPGGVTIGVIDDPAEVNVSGKDIQTILNEQVMEGMFRVFISTHMDVDEEGNFQPMIQNVGRNKFHCWVEIIDEHDNVLYETDVIPPGYKVEEDTMEPLAAKGLTECEAIFHIIDGSTKAAVEVNSVSVAIDIVQK